MSAAAPGARAGDAGVEHGERAEHDAALSPPHALPGPRPRGVIKHVPADFQVTELADHGDGDGDGGAHLWLEIEREDMNTAYAAGILARICGVRRADVGYAGLKDRHARSRQWFSVPAARDVPGLDGALGGAGLHVLARARRARKLRRGALDGNRFRILVRTADADAAAVADGCARVARDGVPNYFGPQRFGHGGGNLRHARQMLCAGAAVRDRHRRGLYLSAARSALFNRVLSARVRDGSWCRLLPGEAAILAGSASFFVAGQPDAALSERLARFDISPSGPLWGRGGSPAQGEAARVERDALAGSEALMAGLEAAAMDHGRRALRLAVSGLEWDAVPGTGCRLAFSLPAGGYATVVLRELFDVDPGGD